jgi:O-antigen/teichoic acid export membrane protein
LWHNVIAGVATLLGGGLGFALQSLSSHALHPGDYGKAYAVSTLFGLLTKPAAAFSRLLTWSTSRERATTETGHTETSGLLLRDMTIRLFVGGSVIAGLLVLIRPVLATYIHVPWSYIVVSAVSIPFTLAGPPLIGKLQGEERFVPWSALSVLVALSRLVFVAMLVFSFGAFGFLVGITVASAVTFLVTLAVVWPDIRGHRGRYVWRPVFRFLAAALVSTITISVFLAVDTIMAEHYFDKVKGGLYSAAAVLGRAIFFLTGGVASVQFPKVAARHARGRSTVGVVTASLGLCAGCGLIGSGILQIFGRRILQVFAGKAYVSSAGLLGWYGVGMMLLSCAVVLVNTQQSLNRPSLMWVLAPMAFLEPVLIFFFHRTLLAVVLASDGAIAVFVLVMGVVYALGERGRRPGTADGAVPDRAPLGVAATLPVP